MQRQQAPFEHKDLRHTLGTFVTGVTVITTRNRMGKAHGLTANSFNTVSLEPPLILWSLSKRSGSYPVFECAEEFAISILAEEQTEVSKHFASPSNDKFEGVAVNEDFCGLPVIEDSCAWLHCRSVSRFDGGDHTIFIGEILQLARGDRRPLAFGGGRYLLVRSHDEAWASTDQPPP